MVSPVEIEIIAKLVLSAVLGMIIGLERQLHDKPAGLREHGLVCMGSALFTVVSLTFTSPVIAAGVVTGIGFLGAGAILHLKNRVVGLTTASELWVVAAIGLAVGIGFYTIATVTTILVLVMLVSGRYVEKIK
ncbi:MAG: MgtC/SapB family protein [Candidatus Aenigmarchaeota archaeon]|nr:MgtC/SapB family protein [Candidatus Aenigmarchaeota archaeon]